MLLVELGTFPLVLRLFVVVRLVVNLIPIGFDDLSFFSIFVLLVPLFACFVAIITFVGFTTPLTFCAFSIGSRNKRVGALPRLSLF